MRVAFPRIWKKIRQVSIWIFGEYPEYRERKRLKVGGTWFYKAENPDGKQSKFFPNEGKSDLRIEVSLILLIRSEGGSVGQV